MSSKKGNKLNFDGMHNDAPPQIFQNASKLRANMTETETLLWEKLRVKPMGYKFRRQHPINLFVLDFYCHKLKLSIEIDGGYHLTKIQKLKDIERTKTINDLGIKEIRFTNEEVVNSIETVMKSIKNEIIQISN